MKNTGIVIVVLLIILGIIGYTQQKAMRSLFPDASPTIIPTAAPTSVANPTDNSEAVTIPTETPNQVVWDKEFTPIINPNNDDVIVQVEKRIDNYAMGTVGKYGGVVWYAVKINGQWKEVWSGQNVISCKPVQQYNIPKEIYDMGGENSGCSNNY